LSFLQSVKGWLKMEIENLLNEETKICPDCAETIKLKAIKCRFCNKLFDPEEVGKRVDARRDELTKKMERKVKCPQCGNWDTYVAVLKNGTYGNYCSHCKKSLGDMNATEKPIPPSQKMPVEVIDRNVNRKLTPHDNPILTPS